MQVPLGPMEHVDPPAFIPAEAPAACKEGVGETPTDARYTGGSIWANCSIWTAVTIQPNVDTIWLETGTITAVLGSTRLG